MEDILNDESLKSNSSDFSLDNYLVDIESVKNKAFIKAKELLANSSEKFEKSAIISQQEYSWLSSVKTTLLTPSSTDTSCQFLEIDTFIDSLKNDCSYLKTEHLPNLLPDDYNEPILGFDTETTGLDTRTMYKNNGDLDPQTLLVGVSVASDENTGYYLPVRHTEDDQKFNWTTEVMSYFLSRLNKEFCLIIHNSMYDRQVIALNGAKDFRSFPYFFDTQLLYYLLNTDKKRYGLKYLSETVLNRKMIDIFDLFEKQEDADFIRFDFISASKAYLYACSDATNTLMLFKSLFENQSPTNPLFFQEKPVEIDHKFVDTLIIMYRQGFPVDVQYSIQALKDLLLRVNLLQKEIYSVAGTVFNIGSGKQLSELIFDKLKIPPLPRAEKNKSGYYPVTEEDLLDLQDRHPEVVFLKYCVLYRKLVNSISKSYTKYIKNSYVDALHPFTRGCLSFSQTNVPTGRLASNSNGELEHVLVKPVKPTKKNPDTFKYKYVSSSGTLGINSQAINSAHYKLVDAKKLETVPDDILQLSNTLNSEIELEFIKILTE